MVSWAFYSHSVKELIKCLRCGRILTSKESIERKYGKTCWNIIQLQKNDRNVDQELQFLKYEINFLKRQLKELKQNGSIVNIETIERIKPDEHRPERNQFKVQFNNVVVKELKFIFQDKNNFDYHNILSPVNSRTQIEDSPIIIENLELIN